MCTGRHQAAPVRVLPALHQARAGRRPRRRHELHRRSAEPAL